MTAIRQAFPPALLSSAICTRNDGCARLVPCIGLREAVCVRRAPQSGCDLDFLREACTGGVSSRSRRLQAACRAGARQLGSIERVVSGVRRGSASRGRIFSRMAKWASWSQGGAVDNLAGAIVEQPGGFPVGFGLVVDDVRGVRAPADEQFDDGRVVA